MTLEEKGKETKSIILNAALECFSSKGYEGAQVEEICEMAGVSKGAFYYHFTTKQDILLMLLNQWIDKFSVLLDDAKAGSDNFLSIILELPQKIKPIFIDDLNQIKIFLEFYIKGIDDPILKDTVSKSYQSYLDYFSEIIQQGIDAGYIKKIDPRKVARLLFALTVGLLIQGLIDPEGEDWESFAIDSLKMIFR